LAGRAHNEEEKMMPDRLLTQRAALGAGVAALALPAIPGALAQPAVTGRTSLREFNLALEHRSVNITGRSRPAMAINGTIPGPILRFREGEEMVIHVANRLREHTSIHWHGLILPSSEDGVPGVSDGFQGIPAGADHTYRFPLIQSGTYWYHSHSATQEQSGIYGPLIIDPLRPEPYRYDRDYIVILSDWTDENPHRVIENLKRDPGYYNYNKRSGMSLLRELSQAPDAQTCRSVIREHMMWGNMRMAPTDIEDVTGYTFLVNGRTGAELHRAVPARRVGASALHQRRGHVALRPAHSRLAAVRGARPRQRRPAGGGGRAPHSARRDL
jgi:CopA family copper-resistance protein